MYSQLDLVESIYINKNEYGIPHYTSGKYNLAEYISINDFFSNDEDLEDCIKYIMKNYKNEKPFFYKLLTDKKKQKYSLSDMNIFVRSDIFKSYQVFFSIKKNSIEMKAESCQNEMKKEELGKMNEGEQNNIDSITEKKTRAENVHRTYIAIIKFYNEILTEQHIGKKYIKEEAKNEIKNLLQVKADENREDVLIGKAFENFWKNFPDKYKAGPGNPNYKNK